MVFRVCTQPDKDMLGYARDLKFNESQLLKENAFGQGANIWKCATHTSDGLAYWIGHISGDNVEIYAYLALIPCFLGDLRVLEAKKGWTESAWRRKGLARALLQTAAKEAPVASDSDGMTEMAFAQWGREYMLRRRWWDVKTAQFVDESTVPMEDRFTSFENGKRWIMVMDLA